MFKTSLTLILFLQVFLAFAQKTSGKVYGNNEVLEDVFVINVTQDKSQQTDEKGNFTINAAIGDSLIFNAPFFATQGYRIEEYQLNEIWVVELDEDLNQLDEVRVSGERKQEIALDLNQTSQNIMASVKEDNPSGYAGQSTNGNLMGLVSKAAGLFKKKKEASKRITYKQLDTLFKTSNLFTSQLLAEQLMIPEENQGLFLEYCATKYLSKELLKEDRQFELLDRLVKYSKQFQDMLKESEETDQ